MYCEYTVNLVPFGGYENFSESLGYYPTGARPMMTILRDVEVFQRRVSRWVVMMNVDVIIGIPDGEKHSRVEQVPIRVAQRAGVYVGRSGYAGEYLQTH